MTVSSPCKWLVAAASAALFFAPVAAQTENTTITVDDKTVVVDASSLAAAVAVVSSVSDSGIAYSTAETLQLTDDIVANLTTIGLQNATLFAFDDTVTTDATEKRSGSCKVYPGDQEWPSDIIWYIFNILVGGRLIPTIPSASSCYDDYGNYDASECTYVTDEWTNSTLHMDDPTSIMWPLYQGRTCLPTTLAPADSDGHCTLGGYPSYAVNVSTVAQIQLAVNFARNANLRLVVKNTGHDFNGKSTGAGALSIWTHHLKELTLITNYKSSSYSGKAVKLGSGAQAFEIYEFARDNSITLVGGEGRTVGVGGGYLAGGGHSPLSSLYGMAADQVLAMEVVLPDGRFVTATETMNSDIFWALRGGGGSTYGVVTSVTVQAKPVIQVTTVTFSFATGSNVTSDTFWQGVRDYYDYFVTFTDAGVYSYFSMVATGVDSYSFGMAPFFAPNLTVAETEALLAPWFAQLTELGITIEPVYGHYDDFYDAWWAVFPLETVGSTSIKTASRLFPKANWDNSTILDTTFNAIKSVVEDGGAFLSFNIAAAPKSGYPDNAVNPAWRETCHHAIAAIIFDGTANDTVIAAASETMTTDWMQRWRDVSEGAGAYMSEADVSEPNFQQAFWGTNYDRLYALKQQYDPKSVFYVPTGVGSEDWYIEGQLEYLPTQNGRLCKV